MSDKKISGLPGATTPVAGSEVLPIVQSGVTKKVSIDNLTAGKAVSALSLTATNLKTSPATANLDISGTTIAASGSDTNVDLNINAKGSGVAYLNQRWGVNQSGALVTSAGNTYDIGNGTNNPRDVNVDRYVVLNGLTASTALALNASKQTISVTNTGSGNNVLATTPSFASTIGIGGAAAANTGSGITFPAVQSASSNANTLDDYEEGTWTPDLQFGGSNTGITYSIQNGVYIKIGSLVWASFVIVLTSKGSATGTATVSLPFSGPISNETHVSGVATRNYLFGIGYAFKTANATVVFRDSVGGASATDANFQNNSQLGYDIIYRVDF